ncbi:MAG TPA: DUF4347 domain-containing protein, partial [Thiobacillus sp.]
MIEELEPRLLFSADLAPAVLDGSPIAAEQRVLGADGEYAVQASEQESARLEVVFIDTRVDDYQQLLDGIRKQDDGDGSRTIEVVLIDSQDDGITRIGDYLAQQRDVDAVHIISHGLDGAIQLGSTYLDQDTLLERAAQLGTWGNSLSAEADILLYGCDVAAGTEGRAFVDTLAQLTGADVAASAGLTGSAKLGGDGVLEYSSGGLDTGLAVGAETQQNWDGLLVTQTVLDRFTTSGNFNQNAGTQNWAGAWTEVTPANPNVTISSGVMESTRSGSTSTSDYYRLANLSGASSASFSFDVTAVGSNFGANDNVVVYASNNGGSSWTSLGTITGNTAVGAHSYDITSYAASNTAIRLQINHSSTGDMGMSSNDYIDFDNVGISYIVNTAPIAASNTVTTAEDAAYTFAATDFNFSDVDGNALSSVKITTLETVGALKLNGTDVTLNQVISKANIDAGLLTFTPAANGNGAGYDSFGFKVSDGALESAAAYTMTLNVTAVNDAPTAASNTVTTAEDTAYVFSAANFNFSDVDGDALASVKITTLETVGAL